MTDSSRRRRLYATILQQATPAGHDFAQLRSLRLAALSPLEDVSSQPSWFSAEAFEGAARSDPVVVLLTTKCIYLLNPNNREGYPRRTLHLQNIETIIESTTDAMITGLVVPSEWDMVLRWPAHRDEFLANLFANRLPLEAKPLLFNRFSDITPYLRLSPQDPPVFVPLLAGRGDFLNLANNKTVKQRLYEHGDSEVAYTDRVYTVQPFTAPPPKPNNVVIVSNQAVYFTETSGRVIARSPVASLAQVATYESDSTLVALLFNDPALGEPIYLRTRSRDELVATLRQIAPPSTAFPHPANPPAGFAELPHRRRGTSGREDAGSESGGSTVGSLAAFAPARPAVPPPAATTLAHLPQGEPAPRPTTPELPAAPPGLSPSPVPTAAAKRHQPGQQEGRDEVDLRRQRSFDWPPADRDRPAPPSMTPAPLPAATTPSREGTGGVPAAHPGRVSPPTLPAAPASYLVGPLEEDTPKNDMPISGRLSGGSLDAELERDRERERQELQRHVQEEIDRLRREHQAKHQEAEAFYQQRETTLESRLRDLQQQQEQQAAQHRATVGRLNETIQQLQEQEQKRFEEFAQRTEEQRNRLREQEEHVAQLLAEKQALALQQGAAAASAEQAQQYEERLQEASGQLHELTDEFKRTATDYERRMQDMRQQADNLAQEHAHQRAELAALVQQLQKQNSQLQAEKAALTEEHQRQDAELHELKVKSSEIVALEREKARNELQAARDAAVEAVQSEKEKTGAELRKLREQHNQETQDTAERAARELQRQRERLEYEWEDRMEREVRKMRDQCRNEAEVEAERLQRAREEERQRFEQEIDEIRRKLRAAESSQIQQADIDRLKEGNSSLQAELREANDLLKKQSVETSELGAALSDAQKQISQLQSQLEEKQHDITELRAQAMQAPLLQEANDALKVAVRMAEEDRKRLADHIADLKELLTSKGKELELSAAQAAEYQKLGTDVKGVLAAKDEELRQRQEADVQRQQDLTETRQRLAEQVEESVRVAAHRDHLQQQLTATLTALQEREEQLQQATRHGSDAELQANGLREELSAQAHQQSALASLNAQLQEELAQRESTGLDADRRISELQVQVAELRERCAQLDGTRMEQLTLLDEKDHQLQKFQEEVEIREDELRRELERMEAECDEKSLKIQQFDQQLDDIVSKKDLLISDRDTAIADLQDRMGDLDKERAQTAQQLQEAKQQLAEANRLRQQQERETQALERDLRRRVEDSEGEYRRFMADLEAGHRGGIRLWRRRFENATRQLEQERMKQHDRDYEEPMPDRVRRWQGLCQVREAQIEELRALLEFSEQELHSWQEGTRPMNPARQVRKGKQPAVCDQEACRHRETKLALKQKVLEACRNYIENLEGMVDRHLALEQDELGTDPSQAPFSSPMRVPSPLTFGSPLGSPDTIRSGATGPVARAKHSGQVGDAKTIRRLQEELRHMRIAAQKEMQTAQNSHQRELHELHEQTKDWRTKLRKSRERVTQLERTCADLQSRQAQVEQHCEKQLRQADEQFQIKERQFEQLLEQLRKDLRESELSVVQLETCLVETKETTKVANLERALQQKDDQINDLRAERGALADELKKWKSETMELKRRVERIAREQSLIEAGRASSDPSYVDANLVAAKSARWISELEDRLREKDDELQQAMDDHRAYLEELQINHEAEINELRSKLEIAINSHPAVPQLSVAVADQPQPQTVMVPAAQGGSVLIPSLRLSEVNSLELHKRVQELEAEQQDTVMVFESYQEQLRAAREELDECLAHNQELQDTADQLEILVNSKAQQIAEIEHQRWMLDETNTAHLERIEELEDELTVAKSQLLTAKNRIQALVMERALVGDSHRGQPFPSSAAPSPLPIAPASARGRKGVRSPSPRPPSTTALAQSTDLDKSQLLREKEELETQVQQLQRQLRKAEGETARQVANTSATTELQANLSAERTQWDRERRELERKLVALHDQFADLQLEKEKVVLELQQERLRLRPTTVEAPKPTAPSVQAPATQQQQQQQAGSLPLSGRSGSSDTLNATQQLLEDLRRTVGKPMALPVSGRTPGSSARSTPRSVASEAAGKAAQLPPRPTRAVPAASPAPTTLTALSMLDDDDDELQREYMKLLEEEQKLRAKSTGLPYGASPAPSVPRSAPPSSAASPAFSFSPPSERPDSAAGYDTSPLARSALTPSPNVEDVGRFRSGRQP